MKTEFVGAILAVIGIVAGIYLSRMIRRWQGASDARKRAATPAAHASRQAARKAERERRKREQAG